MTDISLEPECWHHGGEELLLRSQEVESLCRIAASLAQQGSFEDKANHVMRELTEIAKADWVTFRLADDNGQNLKLVAMAGPEAVPLLSLAERESLAQTAFRHGEPYVVNDYPSSPKASPKITALGMNSVVLVPVKVQGRVRGLINIVSMRSNHFAPERVNLLTAIGDTIGPVLESVRLDEKVQAHAQEMAVVGEVSRIITSNLNIDQVYEQFVAEVKKLVDFDRSTSI